jgi:predicted ABC-type ATPase
MASRAAVPHIVVVAGPNGAGKSTVAPAVLRENFGVTEFVNADTIAAGLSGLRPEGVAISAGRLMLLRLREQTAAGASFGFETTLATRSFAPWLQRARRDGHRVTIVFFALPDPDMAVARVRERVRAGGHDVPEATIRRRFQRGLANLLASYVPLADEWIVYDNSATSGPRLVAEGGRDRSPEIHDEAFWQQLRSRVPA